MKRAVIITAMWIAALASVAGAALAEAPRNSVADAPPAVNRALDSEPCDLKAKSGFGQIAGAATLPLTNSRHA